MKQHNSLVAAAILALGVSVSGCGGGGGSTVPTTANAGVPAAAAKGTASFVISFPALGTSSTGRVPKYISTNTKSISITEADSGASALAPVIINITSCPTSGGITTCTANVPANPGSDTFAIATFDAADGAGNKLSSGSLTATITAGTANTTVPVVLGGIVASLQLTLGDAFAPIGTKTTLVIAALDASGATIIGTFDNPVTASAGAGASLSATTFTNSADASKITVSYTGEPSSAITISASGDGHTGNATLTPGSGIAYYTVGTNKLYDSGGFQMATGGDGKLYYSSNGSCVAPPGGLCVANSGAIGQFDPTTHAFAEYDFATSQVNGITETPDGAIWALEATTKKIARFAAGTFPSAPTEVASPFSGRPRNFAYGPDGKLWFSSYGGVAKIDLSLPFTAAAITKYNPPTPPGGRYTPYMQGMAWGPDGNLYAADTNNGVVDKISTAGITLNQYNPANGASVRFVAAGADGNMYVTQTTNNSSYPFNGKILKMTTGGLFSTQALPAAAYSTDPDFINSGATSIVWGNLGNSSIGILDASGVRELPSDDYLINQTSGHGTYGVTYAPDHSLWFVCYGNGGISPACLGHMILNATWSVLPSRSINIYGTGTQASEYMGIAESGNSGPFTVTSANPGIAAAANISNHNFAIVGASAGTTQLTVTDAQARSVTINVTVSTTTGTVQSIQRALGGSI